MDSVIDTAVPVLRHAAQVVLSNADWMAWNLFLAFIPLALAARLFRRAGGNVGRPLWWLGAAAWLAFLPNAPYVLTDLIHLPETVDQAGTSWRAAFVVVPQYLAFCALGFGSYVVSLIWLVRMLRQRGWGTRGTVSVELALHLASALGLVLGRFVRLNSWDVLARPHVVAFEVGDALANVSPLAFMAVFFLATCALYWPSKHLVIALVTYVRSGAIARSGQLTQRYL